MGARVGNQNVLELVSGWEAVSIVVNCIFLGIWQFIQITVKRLWKGHRRKVSRSIPAVELTVDSAVGTHYFIKIMGVKYHYVECGPHSGSIVLILSDAPDTEELWGPTWYKVVQRLADNGHRIITLDLRGTGGSEGGSRSELSPPKAIEELSTLMIALGVTETKPAILIGFGVGGILTWYLAHCQGHLVSKFAVIGAPHPNLYWQYPPAAFCENVLHFIQWPYFPERFLAEGEIRENDEARWSSSRACDWKGALNYVRGAAWYRIRAGQRAAPPALLVGGQRGAAQLVASAQHCAAATLRLVGTPAPADALLPPAVLDFLLEPPKESPAEAPSRWLVGRVLGAVARGRLPLPLPAAVHAQA